jgi:hypothetical protein
MKQENTTLRVSSVTQMLSKTAGMEAAEPLWKRVPTHDENGSPLSDFMMIIPKLRSSPGHIIKNIITEISTVLGHYEKTVVFADLNLKLNVLWVSVKPVPGICLELPAAIKMRVPQAMLVGHKLDNN